MRIVIIAQEDPVAFSPFFRRVVEAMPGEIVLIALAGNRGAGGHPRSLSARLQYAYLLWLLLEPAGFLRNAWIRIWCRLIAACGLTGTWVDRRSLRGIAHRHQIPVIDFRDANDPVFVQRLREIAPDVVVNQSELILKKAKFVWTVLLVVKPSLPFCKALSTI